MKLEDAIERVERLNKQLDKDRAKEERFAGPSPNVHAMSYDVEALDLVLKAAKEPRVYALSDHQREALDECLRIARYQRDTTESSESRGLYKSRVDALTAALALQEPFTVGELEYLATAVGNFDPTGYEDFTWDMFETVSAKLRAYIEARKRTMSPNDRADDAAAVR